MLPGMAFLYLCGDVDKQSDSRLLIPAYAAFLARLRLNLEDGSDIFLPDVS
jgi:hypothetical protein